MCPELMIDAGTSLKSQLLDFLHVCAKLWRKIAVIAISKFMKPVEQWSPTFLLPWTGQDLIILLQPNERRC